MLETLYRAKIPTGLSHPLNPSDIARALPEELKGRLKLRFCGEFGMSRYYEIVKSGIEPIIVFQICYSNPELGLSTPNNPINSRWYTEHEDICIYPVRSSDRRKVRQALLDDGFGRAVRWLQLPRSDTWRSGRHSFTLTWSPTTEQLTEARA